MDLTVLTPYLALLLAIAAVALIGHFFYVNALVIVNQLGKDQANQARLIARRKATTSTWWRFILPAIQMLAPLFDNARFANLRKLLGEPYRRAGAPLKLTEPELVCAIVLLTGAFALPTLNMLLMIHPFLAIAFAPTLVLAVPWSMRLMFTNVANTRAKRITTILPYAIDMLVLVLRAGAPLAVGLRKLTEDYADHPIGEEIARVLNEIERGQSRRVAFERFAERIPREEVQILVDSIIQSEELGWPLADTLERLADRISEGRKLKANTFANKAAALVMVPATMMLAGSIILLMAPLVLEWLQENPFE